MAVNLHSSFQLIYEEDKIYIVASKFFDNSEFEAIEICKLTKEIRLTKISKGIFKNDEPSLRVYGVIGFIKLMKAFYMIVITKRSKIGKISPHDIYSISEIKVICCDKQTSENYFDEIDKYYTQMIYDHFRTGGFYFSYTYDLTRSLEKDVDHCRSNCVYSSLVEFNDKYTWNLHMLESVIHIKEIHQYFLPIIHGYIGVCEFQKPHDFCMILISRRNTRRNGTRYFCRGVDDKGNVANYVETEIILITDTRAISFVQVRGSIPLYWSQYPNLTYKPKINVDLHLNQVNHIKKHFDREILERKQETVLNLVDNKGHEMALTTVFSGLIAKLNYDAEKLKYFHFDFHKNCSRMRFENVNILLDTIEDVRTKMGYFEVSLSENKTISKCKNIINRQFGVFRTNCIDCLDRTNVVQSMLAWRTISAILNDQETQLENSSTNFYKKNFEYEFKNIWANNADFLSVQYSGTPALKTDFTRHGVRTIKGMLNDLRYSALRYFYGNFSDGHRQDSFDLISGNYNFNTSLLEAYPKQQKTSFSAILPILFLSLSMILIGDLFFLKSSLQNRSIVAIFIVMGMIFIAKYIFRHPHKYVDLPLLITLNNRDKFNKFKGKN